jgi:hypothetical protein
MSSFYIQNNLFSEFKSVRNDLRFEACKPVYVKRVLGVYMIDLWSEISKPNLDSAGLGPAFGGDDFIRIKEVPPAAVAAR